jgi:hypothetical protein
MATRAEKYAAKLSGDNRKRLYDSQKKQMCELEGQATQDLVGIEYEVKKMASGVSVIQLPYYIIFAKELYMLSSHHQDQTLINEALILERKWVSRGLDNILLEQIKKFYIPAYQIPTGFRLDISLLDGPDVLS